MVLPLGTRAKLFASLHRRALDTGYPKTPWEKLDPSGLSPEEIAILASEWQLRAVSEYRSMVVMGGLIARFPEVGLPLEATGAASRLLADEARHTELCAEVAERLGGSGPSGPIDVDPRDLRVASDGLPAHLVVARETVAMFCVGESASVAVLRALAAAVTDPCITVVLEILLRDEILHDRFGWALAALVVEKLTPAELEWLGHELSAALAHYDRMNHGTLHRRGVVARAPTGSNLGVLRPARIAEAFGAHVETVILPGLVTLGLPAHDAWARACARNDQPAQSP